MNARTGRVLLGAVLLALAKPASAQRRIPGAPVDESYLLNLQTFNSALGVGARAMGMGGAFVAVADDATAASWNPAGLAFLIRPEVSLVADWTTSALATSDFVDTTPNPDAPGQTRRVPGTDEGKGSGLSFLSVAYPLKTLGRRVTLQLSYQRQVRPLSADLFSRDETGAVPAQDAPFIPDFSTERRTHVASGGGVDNLSFGFGAALSETVFVGATVNYWFGSPTAERRTATRVASLPGRGDPQVFTDLVETTTETQRISSLSANLGLLYRPVSWLTLGAVYRSGWVGRANASYATARTGIDTVLYTPPGGEAEYRTQRVDWAGQTEASGSLAWPASYGFGAAFRPMSTLVLSLDFTRQEWSHSSIDLPRVNLACVNDGVTQTCRPNGTPGFYDPAVGAGEYVTHVQYPTQLDAANLAQRDQNSFRAGAEWVLFLGRVTLPVRAGVYRVDSISPYFEASTTQRATQFVVPDAGRISLTGYTLGFSVGLGGLVFDAAFVRDRSTDDREQIDDTPPDTGHRVLTNTRFLAGLTYRF
jgi:long-subunit fatty acid transport protein